MTREHNRTAPKQTHRRAKTNRQENIMTEDIPLIPTAASDRRGTKVTPMLGDTGVSRFV